MVKLVCLVKRKPDLSREEFERHWRERHGPLVAGTPEVARHIVRYEQHRRIAEDEGWLGSPGYDGAAVQWFASVDDFKAFLAEPAYAELIAPDERRFLDVDNLVWLITEEPEVVIDG